jgi:hypothetical protein
MHFISIPINGLGNRHFSGCFFHDSLRHGLGNNLDINNPETLTVYTVHTAFFLIDLVIATCS